MIQNIIKLFMKRSSFYHNLHFLLFCNFLQELFLQVFWALQEFIDKFRVSIELSLESLFGFSSYPGNVGRQGGTKIMPPLGG